MSKGLVALTAVVAAAAIAAGALSLQHTSAGAAGTPRPSGAIVIDWNRELVNLVNTPGNQPSTIHPTRSFAILHTAIYDAVVSTTHGGRPYAYSVNAPAGADADAAAAQAGHDALVALFPARQAALDQRLATLLASIPDGAAKTAGVHVGRVSAALAAGLRAGDGSTRPQPPVPAPSKPGDYRPAPPANAPAVFTQWPDVQPWVLEAAGQFRPGPPPAVASSAYADGVNEVKRLGQDSSAARTADQTEAARFWPGPIWVQWNEIAEASASIHHTDLLQTARVFELLDLAFADTVIAFYDAKYHYLVWRPVSAIRAADTGNPAVVSDPGWTPLLATAPDPSYPGAHSAVSAAGAAILGSAFGGKQPIRVTSDSLLGTVRAFPSYDAAAEEAGLSRIYGGVHTRADHEAGAQLGRQVAAFVLEQSEKPGFGLAGEAAITSH